MDDALDGHDAFRLLADETRVHIIQALGDATGRDGIARLTYSDLKDAVGVRDSGRFNYHLRQLRGNYVEHLADGEGDDAYRLRWPGLILYQTIVAGSFTEERRVEPFDAGFACLECGDGVTARYSDGNVFHLDCPDCGASYGETFVPPQGVLGRPHAEMLRVADRHARAEVGQMVRGQCPWCASDVEARLHERVDEEDLPSHDYRDLDVYATNHCTNCTGFHYTTVGERLRYESAAIAFYHDHGLDLLSIPHWELPWAATDRYTTVRSTDPWDVEVWIELGDERLVARVDGDLDAETRIEEL